VTSQVGIPRGAAVTINDMLDDCAGIRPGLPRVLSDENGTHFGGTVVYHRGHVTASDSPAVRAVAEKHPCPPGLDPVPRSF
jgi:hypothetical protein